MVNELSTDEGTVMLGLSLPGPNKPSEDLCVMKQELLDGYVEMTHTAAGRLECRVIKKIDNKERDVMRIRSCPITVSRPLASTIIAGWKAGDNMYMLINGKLVATSDNTKEIPDEFDFTDAGEVPEDNTEPYFIDYSSENLRRQKHRVERVQSLQPRPNKQRATPEYLFSALKGEMCQLDDLIKLVEQGKTHHAVGLAARLRLLVGRGGGGTPLPLLQWCAGLIAAPLIVYTTIRPIGGESKVLLDKANFSIVLNASANQGYPLVNPIDLDVWLDSPGAPPGDKPNTQRDIINAIGNTAGAHVSIDLHPFVVMLRSHSSDLGAGRIDNLIRYVLYVARIVLPLCGRVLDQYRAQSTPKAD